MIRVGPDVARWVVKKLGGQFNEGSQGIGLEKEGVLVAGVSYDTWNHRSIMAHIVIEGRMTKEYLGVIFDYPFRQLGVDKVYCPIVETNGKSIKICSKMGFIREATLRDAHPDGDIYLYSLKRQDCRFLGAKNGYKSRRSAGS